MTNNECKTRCRGRPRCFSIDEGLTKALEVFWQVGYEHASIALLCKALNVTAPSLYAAYGSKADLFCKAVDAYENEYWVDAKEEFVKCSSASKAISDFFAHAARILTCPETPCGCLVVMATVNAVTEDWQVVDKLSKIRENTRNLFREKIREGIESGEFKRTTESDSFADLLNIILEGMSFQARFGMSAERMFKAVEQVSQLIDSIKLKSDKI